MATSRLGFMADVNSARQEKAAATRQRMLDAAYDLFCQEGYRATTMAAIAERAGVAVQTVYFTFHTKDALLQEVHEQTVLGRDAIPPPDQPWYVAAAKEPDPRRATELIVGGLAGILSRVAPMLPTFHAVAAEPAGAVFRRGEELRRRGMQDLADQVLLPKNGMRRGVDRVRSGDLLVVLLGPEVYRAFVIELGWTREAWIRWTTNALVRELFESP
jgi:AcrR family transcriptional regulator